MWQFPLRTIGGHALYKSLVDQITASRRQKCTEFNGGYGHFRITGEWSAAVDMPTSKFIVSVSVVHPLKAVCAFLQCAFIHSAF